MSKVCYFPIKGIDDVIASRFGWTSVSANGEAVPDAHRVAMLRSIYDERHEKNPLDLDNLEDVSSKVRTLMEDLGKINTKAINTAASHMSRTYKKLRKAYPSIITREDRVRMISSYFSMILDEYQERFPSVPREAIIKGFKDPSTGITIGGQASLFQDVYNRLMSNRSLYYKGSTDESFSLGRRQSYGKKYQELTKMLDHEVFSSLVARARSLLRDTEGIILGQTLDYVSKASLENYDDTELGEKFDLAESKRDGWQEKTDEKSAFGSVSLEVRKFLSTIPMVDAEAIYDEADDKFNWDDVIDNFDDYIETDDLGYPRYMDPATLHSQIIEVLDGARDENHMIEMLKDKQGNPKQIYYIPIIQALENDPLLRTRFFVDFKKGFQPYSIFFKDDKESKKRGYTYWKTKLLNRVVNLLSGGYIHRIMYGKPLSDKSIFGESTRTTRGKVNWENLGKLKEEVYKWVHETPTTNLFAKSDAKLLSSDVDKATKVAFLMDTFKAMGIDANVSTVEAILTSNARYKVRDILSDYFDAGEKNTGLNLVLKSNLKAFSEKRYSDMKDMSFYQLYNTKQKEEDKQPKLREHTEKLLDIVSKIQEGARLESRCRHDGKTLFSYVAPNFMSDRLGAIRAYVKADDKDGLKEYLHKEYCENSFFVDRAPDGTITHVYNYWLQTLLDCCDTPKSIRLEDTFAGSFVFERDLGNAETPFEKFGSKTHALDMIISYFADEQLSKGFRKVEVVDGNKYLARQQTALCPTFILGDSGVNKNLRVPRILEDNRGWGEKSKTKIVDYLYEVYRQEINRMKMIDAMNKKLNGEGYEGVRNTSKFSTLVFLNDPKYTPESNSMDAVKMSIRRFMDDSTKKFIESLDNLGVTEYQTNKEGKSTGKLKNLRQLGDTKEDIIPKLEDFYWNTKFATIEQLQLMTIDPAFYKGSKDLQKRYKEIHAPGSVLSLLARNPFKPGNPYFNADKNGNPLPETCVYVNDIELSVEETDPNFAAAIKAHKETAKAIEDYRKSSLTDGQGWRTLTSYRKVMGMAGKWTQEMENCYDEIMELRAIYGKRVPNEGDPDFEDYMNRLNSIAKNAVVFQPVKPYLFTHENYTINNGTYEHYADIMPIPVQHKYAEAVLIPELLPKDSQIRDMAYWMDEHKNVKGDEYPIDLIVATTVVKVGAFGATDIKDARDHDSFIAALEKGYVHEFNYRDYRIQNNVPEHINSSQLFGTQIRKLIMSHLRLGGTYNYLKNLSGSPKTINLGGRWGKVDAQNLKGRNLLALYNSLIVANIMESYDEFAKVAGDVNKLADILMQNVLSNSRESMDNLLSYAVTGNADFLIPLFEGGLEHDTAAAILSIFKKKVNKQTIKGGSAVQVSAFGITGYKRDGGLKFVTDPKNPNNILYAECEMPFDLSYYNANLHREVRLDYDTYVNNDGTLKMGRELKEGDPEYDKYQSYVIENADGTKTRYKPLIEVDYPGILDIIAYRIPTERDYSMLNLKVKRFSRKTAGGTIKVPLQGTKIAGFDFDIDKLYFMRKEFKKHSFNTKYSENNYSDEDKNAIFKDIYEQHPEIKKALSVAKSTSKDKSKPLNRYWNEAEIERRFGYNKDELFEYHARDLGIDPETEKEGRDVEYFEEYQFDKTPENNTRTARNNLILDLIRARLMDEETFAERYTPGGFFNASKAAKKLRFLMFGALEKFSGQNVSEQLDRMANDKNEKDPEPDYDPSDPMTIITYNQQNQVAGTLIGIFANQNTNHAFASLMDSFMVKSDNAIEFAGHKFDVDGVGRDFIHPPHRADGMNDVDLYVAELLAASVDAVKDPVLNFLNLNRITADSGAVLIRLGYTAEEVGLLFNQPIIRELCADCMDNSYGVKQGFKSLRNKYQTSVDPKRLSKDLSKETLIQSIIDERKTIARGNNDYVKANIETQYAILELFENICNVAQDVSQFVMNTKFTASNAVSSTFGGMYEQQMRVDDYCDRILKGSESNKIESSTIEMTVVQGNETMESMNTPIINRTDILDMDRATYMDFIRMNPFGYEQAMYDANRKMLRLLAPEDKSKKALFPYGRPIYESARNLLRDISNYNLDGETIDALHRDLPVFLLTNETSSEFCGEAEFEDSGISNREYYTEHFANDLMWFLELHPDLAESNELFQYLKVDEQVDENGITTGFSMTVQDVGGLDPTKKEAIKEAWASLLDGPEEYQKIANDLFIYCYYKLGFDFSSFTFMDLAPTYVKEKVIVRRNQSLPIRTFTETKPDSNDVFVFYTGHKEHEDEAWNNYHYIEGAEGLVGDSYALNLFDEEENEHYEVFKELFDTARENSDRVFKVQIVLDQNDIDEISKYGDIPSNVQFREEDVLRNDWSDVSYGKERSYAEFLREILDGTNNSLETEEFIKQFILNNLDNYRFVLSSYPSQVKDFLSDLVKGISMPKTIRVDVSNKDSDIQNSLVSVSYSGRGEIIAAKWQPVIKINDSYYMADGRDGMRFDVNKSLSMEYKLVTPLGVKGKSKSYTTTKETYMPSDSKKPNGKSEDKTPPSSPTEPITEPEASHYEEQRIDTLIRIIDNNLLNTFKLLTDDKGNYSSDAEMQKQLAESKEQLGISSDLSVEKLEDLVNQVREHVRSMGLEFVDENGNKKPSC